MYQHWEANQTLEGFKHGFLAVNGARIHAVQIGDGPLVLLLHSFPELCYSCRHQMRLIDEFEADVRGWIRDIVYGVRGRG
jgi:hypothetical protein